MKIREDTQRWYTKWLKQRLFWVGDCVVGRLRDAGGGREVGFWERWT
jgi:hypothetical protein